MLSKHAKKSLMERELISERTIWARLRTKVQNVTIIQCYAPTKDAEDEDKECFYEQLRNLYEKILNEIYNF